MVAMTLRVKRVLHILPAEGAGVNDLVWIAGQKQARFTAPPPQFQQNIDLKARSGLAPHHRR